MVRKKEKDKLQRLEHELSFLYRVARTVHSLELDNVLQEIVAIAVQVTSGDSCLIYVLDPKRQELILRASKNPHPDLLQKITMKLGEGITGWVAKEKKPVAIAAGANKDPRFKFFRSLPEDRFEAFLSVPILNKRGVVGVMNVQHEKKHDHSPVEIRLFSAIGKLVGGAVENALLVEETLVLKEALQLRKVVEKAKGILMKHRHISEEEAYRTMQRESMQRRTPLKDIAEAICLAEQLVIETVE